MTKIKIICTLLFIILLNTGCTNSKAVKEQQEKIDYLTSQLSSTTEQISALNEQSELDKLNSTKETSKAISPVIPNTNTQTNIKPKAEQNSASTEINDDKDKALEVEEEITKPAAEPVIEDPPVIIDAELLLEYQDKLLLAYNLGTATHTNFTKLSNQLTDYYNEWKNLNNRMATARSDYLNGILSAEEYADLVSEYHNADINLSNLSKIVEDGEALKLSISNYIDTLEYIVSSIEKGNDLSVSQLDLVHKYQNEIYNNESKNYYIGNIIF
ncbi:hypothetical protein KKF32_04820 [Patescibacteria group bacterium]|nr:hypothetical protein [Patescibacteria group bacterium]